MLGSPNWPSPRLDLTLPARLRVPSGHSVDSRVSDTDGVDYKDVTEPPKSPAIDSFSDYGLGLIPSSATAPTNSAAKVDVLCKRPGDDISQVDDGPLFRATLTALEQKTGVMRARWKKVLKKAEAAQERQEASNAAVAELMDALREVSSSTSTAVQPAVDHYFDKIAKEILAYERLNTVNIQKMIIDPIYKLYTVDIKQADAKKKDFEDESKEYYAYVGRYLGQHRDSLKEKKRAETDSKYQSKRRTYELKRFDYSSFMQDLNGGRKAQEVLSALTRYADAQAKSYLNTAKKIEAMLPQLEALNTEVKAADKEFQLQRTEREEKRRALEKSTKPYNEPDPPPSQGYSSATGHPNGKASDGSDRQRAASTTPVFQSTISPPPVGSPSTNGAMPVISALPSQNSTTGNQVPQPAGSPNMNKFKGIRDLEDKDYSALASLDSGIGQHRKEGLLWALSRPGSHVDPKGLNKQAWHK